MGQARIRGTQAQRIEQAQAAHAALTDEQREAIAWRRTPAADRRLRTQVAALGLVAEILFRPTPTGALDPNRPAD